MALTNVILVAANGWVDRAPELQRRGRQKVLGYFKAWWRGVTYFHRDGHTYTVASVRPAKPLAVIDRILASTIYNPGIDLEYEYVRGPTWTIDQLRAAIRRAIEQDDDVLTQFHEPGDLLDRLDRATTFEGVAAVLDLAATPRDAA